MADTWSQIAADPAYQGLPPDHQKMTQDAYFQRTIGADPEFTGAPPNVQNQIRSSFYQRASQPIQQPPSTLSKVAQAVGYQPPPAGGEQLPDQIGRQIGNATMAPIGLAAYLSGAGEAGSVAGGLAGVAKQAGINALSNAPVVKPALQAAAREGGNIGQQLGQIGPLGQLASLIPSAQGAPNLQQGRIPPPNPLTQSVAAQFAKQVPAAVGQLAGEALPGYLANHLMNQALPIKGEGPAQSQAAQDLVANGGQVAPSQQLGGVAGSVAATLEKGAKSNPVAMPDLQAADEANRTAIQKMISNKFGDDLVRRPDLSPNARTPSQAAGDSLGSILQNMVDRRKAAYKSVIDQMPASKPSMAIPGFVDQQGNPWEAVTKSMGQQLGKTAQSIAADPTMAAAVKSQAGDLVKSLGTVNDPLTLKTKLSDFKTAVQASQPNGILSSNISRGLNAVKEAVSNKFYDLLNGVQPATPAADGAPAKPGLGDQLQAADKRYAQDTGPIEDFATTQKSQGAPENFTDKLMRSGSDDIKGIMGAMTPEEKSEAQLQISRSLMDRSRSGFDITPKAIDSTLAKYRDKLPSIFDDPNGQDLIDHMSRVSAAGKLANVNSITDINPSQSGLLLENQAKNPALLAGQMVLGGLQGKVDTGALAKLGQMAAEKAYSAGAGPALQAVNRMRQFNPRLAEPIMAGQGLLQGSIAGRRNQ
jgi:hypothetical protein